MAQNLPVLMVMNVRVVLIIVCLFLLMLLGVGGWVGYSMGQPYKSEGGGQTRRSPDGKYVAHASTRTEKTRLGASRRYSELKIETATPTPQIVRKMVVEDTAEPAMDWRIEGDVFWSRNSGSVTFKCVTGKANLEVTLTP
jgi:hypothetical protein